MTPEQLFLAHLPHVEKVVEHHCRRHHFRREETQDFLSEVHLKLVDDDYAVLRKFQGRSNIRTYLAMVISNLLKDHENRLWGKWRSSAEAERLGPVAVLLERLVRDGYSFDEIVQILQTNHKVAMSWQALYEVATRLPVRIPRHLEGEEGLQDLPAPDSRADARILDQEKTATLHRAREALQKALKVLPPEDQLILKMQSERRKVADISRVLGLDQKQLYRRIERDLQQLSQELERHGIRKEDIREILE